MTIRRYTGRNTMANTGKRLIDIIFEKRPKYSEFSANFNKNISNIKGGFTQSYSRFTYRHKR